MTRLVNDKQKGFTLIEVVIVMALIAILSLTTVLSLAFYIPNLRLKAATQEINIQLQKARLEAIRQSRRCYVDFFRTVDGQVFSPFIWVERVDAGGNPVGSPGYSNPASPLYEPGLGDLVVFSLPVEIVDGEWELSQYRGVRYGTAVVPDGVENFPVVGALPMKGFYFNSRGISSATGSLHLRNARDRNREIMLTLGGATRIQ